MTTFSKILAGAAGLAMAAGAAAPAAAQYSPYGGYNGGYNSGGVVGAVINSVLGGGRYGAYGQGNDRVAVDQCARAAEARVSYTNRANASRNYGQAYGDPRYNNQRYGYNTATSAQVIGITGVQRQRNGVKVSGVINSGLTHRSAYGNQAYGYGNQGYGYGNQAYGYGNQAYPNQAYNPYVRNSQVADLRFSCRVNYRGQVSNLDIKRNVVARRAY
ncbi:MAG TPA: hypothetical protein VMN38_05655 [Sphingomicrobium sp.]|nr:hypothetical protein [Sphingomicrobium sp.]